MTPEQVNLALSGLSAMVKELGEIRPELSSASTTVYAIPFETTYMRFMREKPDLHEILEGYFHHTDEYPNLGKLLCSRVYQHQGFQLRAKGKVKVLARMGNARSVLLWNQKANEMPAQDAMPAASGAHDNEMLSESQSESQSQSQSQQVYLTQEPSASSIPTEEPGPEPETEIDVFVDRGGSDKKEVNLTELEEASEEAKNDDKGEEVQPPVTRRSGRRKAARIDSESAPAPVSTRSTRSRASK